MRDKRRLKNKVGVRTAQSVYRLGYGLHDRGSISCGGNDGTSFIFATAGAHPASYQMGAGNFLRG
jgi:hypothetical protein